MIAHLNLTMEESKAFFVIRKAMKRKPELAAELMKGMSKDVACSVLMQAKQELDTLLAVSRAFSAAAQELTKLENSDVDN